jgi:hypothetical protein
MAMAAFSSFSFFSCFAGFVLEFSAKVSKNSIITYQL